ncbi:mitochondrial basic amino acids transporter-like isoform X1 [Stylophora pistillata]|uniref:Mitochondrial carnitine/acylcarnitine carrier protein CACL n=1 Tax=Stylophora pistillata TaxID=50429 RepID=A0A2B4RVH7_STYPI|nr:mitochondrial basic amino acids transporter-like isoform X1 [Stylophora pistillata]PFX20255.1 Mitochondrial carnitine/acylcarnitine carrier protein CACL [Stylophora pistillata]
MEVGREFIAGWCAGCTGVIVTQPLDTVKVRMQVLSSGSKPAATTSLSCFYNIIKHETIFGLFKGMAPPLAAVALQNAILFGVYGNVLKMFSSKNGDKPALSHVCFAAAASGAAQLWVVGPMELIKIKLQLQTEGKHSKSSHYRGAMDCIRKIYKTAGSRGLFQGATPLIFRDIPGFVVYFASYEILLDALSQRKSTTDTQPLVTMLAGGLAGMIGWFSTFPFDGIKTRMQADGNKGLFTYKGTVDCFLQTYRAGGVKSLFAGVGPCLLRAFPHNAVVFVVYNLVSKWLGNCISPVDNGYNLKVD